MDYVHHLPDNSMGSLPVPAHSAGDSSVDPGPFREVGMVTHDRRKLLNTFSVPIVFNS